MSAPPTTQAALIAVAKMIARTRPKTLPLTRLSDLAVAKLRGSGISAEIAEAAGVFSVDDAKTELHDEFAAAPALVFQYFDIAGAPIIIDRDGEFLQFVRVRYLGDPPAKGFLKRARQRYAQLRASGVQAYFPKVVGIDWRAIATDACFNIVLTEGELKSLCLCAQGIPAIGIGGVDCFVQKLEQGQ